MDKFECTKILKLKKTPQTNHRYKNNTCNTINLKNTKRKEPYTKEYLPYEFIHWSSRTVEPNI